MDQPKTNEITLRVDDSMTWDEYKQFVAESTSFDKKAELIEKYVSLPPEEVAAGKTLGQVPVRVILRTVKGMFEGFTDPKASASA